MRPVLVAEGVPVRRCTDAPRVLGQFHPAVNTYKPHTQTHTHVKRIGFYCLARESTIIGLRALYCPYFMCNDFMLNVVQLLDYSTERYKYDFYSNYYYLLALVWCLLGGYTLDLRILPRERA